jgi:hypothetical protein
MKRSDTISIILEFIEFMYPLIFPAILSVSSLAAMSRASGFNSVIAFNLVLTSPMRA